MQKEDKEKAERIYIKVPEKDRNRGIKKGLLILAIIFAVIVIGGVLVNVLANSLLTSLGLKDSRSGQISTIALPNEDYVAEIYVEGTIQASNIDGWGLSYGYQHDYTLALIDKLIEDKRNKAILMWVNSPGGTIYESDELYLALVKYKQITGRPVYSVMGSMAASGGYYVSAPADKIWANRNTWTGSIGVTLGTFIEVSDLLEKYGVKTTTITSGENKAMGSQFEPMTEKQKKIFQDLVDEAYLQFAGIVSQNRDLSLERVKEIGDGRIYSAKQALDLGLIDNIGTKDEAFQDLKIDYNLGEIKLESFYYIDNSFLGRLLGLGVKDLFRKDSGDIGALKEILKENEELKPMYIYK